MVRLLGRTRLGYISSAAAPEGTCSDPSARLEQCPQEDLQSWLCCYCTNVLLKALAALERWLLIFPTSYILPSRCEIDGTEYGLKKP